MSKRLTAILNNAKSSMASAVSSHFGVRPLSEVQEHLDNWLQTPLGRRLLARQQRHLEQLLSRIFGYHLMQLSISRHCDLASASPINHRFHLSVQASDSARIAAAIAQFEALPLASEAIDVAILHHVLDYSLDPRRLLSEASRVIIPHGYLLIIGFNPHSLFGFYKPLAQLISRSFQWRRHCLRLGQLIGWLHSLDFETICTRYDDYGLPSNGGDYRWLNTIGGRLFPVCGAFYILLARKQVMSITPVQRLRRKQHPLAGWGKASAMPRKY